MKEPYIVNKVKQFFETPKAKIRTIQRMEKDRRIAAVCNKISVEFCREIMALEKRMATLIHHTLAEELK